MANSPCVDRAREKSEDKRVELRKLWKLFLSTFYLSAFTFGGGYVIITLMKKKFVDEYHWIDESEMLDLVAIAQSSPGALAVNGAIAVGYKLMGVMGAVVAVVATILPPFFVISFVTFIYDLFRENPAVVAVLEGMQAGVAAVIASVVWDMGAGVVRSGSLVKNLVMVAAFVAAYVCHVSAGYIVLVCIVLGLARAIWNRKEA